MKLIIEIDEEKYKFIKENPDCPYSAYWEEVRNGIPYNPTGDLISREDLIKAIEQGEGISWDSHGKDDLCVRKKYIDNAPTVEARPQGEWIDVCTLPIIRKCSICGNEIGNEMGLYNNFCPNCGADMRKGGAE